MLFFLIKEKRQHVPQLHKHTPSRLSPFSSCSHSSRALFPGPFLFFGRPIYATFSLKLTSFHYSSCQFAQMVADNFEGTEYALPYGASPTPIGKTDRYSIFKVRLDVTCPAPVYSRNPIFWPTSAGHC